MSFTKPPEVICVGIAVDTTDNTKRSTLESLITKLNNVLEYRNDNIYLKGSVKDIIVKTYIAYNKNAIEPTSTMLQGTDNEQPLTLFGSGGVYSSKEVPVSLLLEQIYEFADNCGATKVLVLRWDSRPSTAKLANYTIWEDVK